MKLSARIFLQRDFSHAERQILIQSLNSLKFKTSQKKVNEDHEIFVNM